MKYIMNNQQQRNNAQAAANGGRNNGQNVQGGNNRNNNRRQHNIQNQINVQVAQFQSTKVYLQGRDKIYPDAAALARFNNWVAAHQAQIDPNEQKVCNVCGHVGFDLCPHAILQAAPAPAAPAVIVPQNLRHFGKSLNPLPFMSNLFKWPSFDTHATDDANLNGFNNNDLSNDLVLPELFAHLLINMQTSYKVLGRDDRELRLAHCHKLALKYYSMKGKEAESQLEDMHTNVRVKVTIQRACDNMQNSMIYDQRTPARNFGSAWFPKSPMGWVFLIICIIYLITHPSVFLGLCALVLKGVYIAGCLIGAICSSMADIVPVALPKIWNFVSAHQNGNVPKYLCVSNGITTRLFVPADDAHYVTQSCEFSDWAIALLSEVSFQIWDIITKSIGLTSEQRLERCLKLQLSQVSIAAVKTAEEGAKLLGLGQMTLLDGFQLWLMEMNATLQQSIYRC